MKTSPLAAAIAALVVACLAATASAGSVTEAETNGSASNNSLATSEAITSGGYSTTSDPEVFGGSGTEGSITGLLTAQLSGHGGGSDVDFYALTFYSSGDIWFDVDGPFAIDVMLSLFDSTGTLIAFNDDDLVDADTTDSQRNSFLGVMQVGEGTYYLAVSQWPNFPNGLTGSSQNGISDDARTTFTDSGDLISGAGVDATFGTNGNQPGGGAYTVNITTSALTNPEPGTMALFALGAAGLAGIVHRRRRRRLTA